MRVMNSLAPQVAFDPYGTYSSFALPRWDPGAARGLTFPAEIIEADRQRIDPARPMSAVRTRWNSLRAERSPHTELTLRSGSSLVRVRLALHPIRRDQLVPALLLNAAIAGFLLASGALVAGVARSSRAARAYFALSSSGALMVATIVEYHMVGDLAPLFFVGFGGATIALLSFIEHFPSAVASASTSRALRAFQAAIASVTVLAASSALVGRVPLWQRLVLSWSNSIALLGLVGVVIVHTVRAPREERPWLWPMFWGVIVVPVLVAIAGPLGALFSVRVLHVLVPLGLVSTFFVLATRSFVTTCSRRRASSPFALSGSPCSVVPLRFRSSDGASSSSYPPSSEPLRSPSCSWTRSRSR